MHETLQTVNNKRLIEKTGRKRFIIRMKILRIKKPFAIWGLQKALLINQINLKTFNY